MRRARSQLRRMWLSRLPKDPPVPLEIRESSGIRNELPARWKSRFYAVRPGDAPIVSLTLSSPGPSGAEPGLR